MGTCVRARAKSHHDDTARVQQRENLLAWLLAARAGTARRDPEDSIRAKALARHSEDAPIAEVALSSIRAGARACLADGDWAGAARSAGRALDLLSDLIGRTGPDTMEDWLALTQGMAATGAYGLARQGEAHDAALLCERGAAMIASHTGISNSGVQGDHPPRQVAVPPGCVLVQLAVTPVGGIALLTRPDRATVTIGLPALTDDKVTWWDMKFRRPGGRTAAVRSRTGTITDPADAQAVLDEMATALGPLCECLHDARVRLVPLGRIAGLPLSPVIELRTGSPVSIAGSAALHLRAAAAARLRSPPIRTLAVTNPSPCSAGPPLPGATTEGEWLTGCEACAVTHLDGIRATRAAVLAALGSGMDLVHFGTHGQFDADNPLRGALYLADGPGGRAEILGPAELSGAAAVVLACCTLGDVGRRLPDEHQGFSSAMLSAGAWFVLSPLWPVDDAAATDLVTGFYRYLLDGSNPASALLAARALAREQHGARSPCWASWTLAGG